MRCEGLRDGTYAAGNIEVTKTCTLETADGHKEKQPTPPNQKTRPKMMLGDAFEGCTDMIIAKQVGSIRQMQLNADQEQDVLNGTPARSAKKAALGRNYEVGA